MSRLTCVRTIRIGERPNLLWLELETDEGLTGLGEAFRGAQAVEAVLHEHVAPWLLGRDARRIEPISRHLLTPYVGFGASSAEIRAASAVDIALWDLAGKRHGVPVHEALGGASREKIRAYNTCAGYDYNSRGDRRAIGEKDAAAGPYDDQVAFTRDAGALAESLLGEGYAAMKIWPFDPFAAAGGGQTITLDGIAARSGAVCQDPRRGGRPDRNHVRAAQPVVGAGRRADLPGAGAVPCVLGGGSDRQMDDLRALADLRRRTRTPICASETLGGQAGFPPAAGSGCGGRGDARSELVRRSHRSPQDRRPGRSLQKAAGAP